MDRLDDKFKEPDILKYIKPGRLGWAGHGDRMAADMIPKNVLIDVGICMGDLSCERGIELTRNCSFQKAWREKLDGMND